MQTQGGDRLSGGDCPSEPGMHGHGVQRMAVQPDADPSHRGCFSGGGTPSAADGGEKQDDEKGGLEGGVHGPEGDR